MDYNEALFADSANTSVIPADMLNTNADGSTDWNAVLTSGIRGAAEAAIRSSVGSKYASGQLQPMPGQRGTATGTRNLLLIAAAVYLMVKM